jgi:hypothetical protein
MSPEATQEKLTVTMAPPPAALAADKKKAAAKKRTEAENLIDGHAAGIKTDKPTAEKELVLTSQGRKGGLLGFVIFGVIAFWTLTKYGRFLHADLVILAGQSAFESAYHHLADPKNEWFFGYTTRMTAFRIFATLSPLFLLFALAIPRQFGRFWIGLGLTLGTIMTPIMIGTLFYVGVAPLAIAMKLLGKDPLNRGKHDGSYWLAREKPRKPDHFEHLF